MARFEVSGIEAAQEAFLRRSERAAKAVPKMLKAGGAVLEGRTGGNTAHIYK